MFLLSWKSNLILLFKAARKLNLLKIALLKSQISFTFRLILKPKTKLLKHMVSMHHLELCQTFVFGEIYPFVYWTACFYYCLCWFCIYMLLFIFLNWEVNHHYCIGFIWEGCLLYGLMLFNIKQWFAEIGNFNGYSLHSVVKLHLNLFNLLFNMYMFLFTSLQ